MTDQDNQAFKVSDKRRFTEEGKSERDFSSDEKKVSTTDKAVENKAAENRAVENNQNTEQSSFQGELNFSSFLFGMYTQTVIFLGDIPHPETNVVSTNLEAAKQNIDIMGILEEKTKGNLTSDESKLFEEIINTLRLQYVKKLKK